jgi:hypothetical protein
MTYADVLEHDSSPSLVLVLHQLLGMFTFFIRSVFEVLAKSRESHIVTVEVEGLQEVNDKLLQSEPVQEHRANSAISCYGMFIKRTIRDGSSYIFAL